MFSTNEESTQPLAIAIKTKSAKLKKIFFKWTDLQNRMKLTENELKVAGGRDSQGVWEGHVHTAILKTDNQQGLIAHSIAHGTLLDVRWKPAWEVGLGRMDTCPCMAESLRYSPETITTLLICYAPV